MTNQTDAWEGTFGNDYTDRNVMSIETTLARRKLFEDISNEIHFGAIDSILEVGANSGNNISVLHSMMQHSEISWTKLYAIEPNVKAFGLLIMKNITNLVSYFCTWEDFYLTPACKYDMVFTSGVLIHVHPDSRKAFMQKIVDASNKYVVAIEYFAPKDRELEYRDNKNLLWVTDFGEIYKDMGLKPISCKFYWKETTGLDNLTVWVFKK